MKHEREFLFKEQVNEIINKKLIIVRSWLCSVQSVNLRKLTSHLRAIQNFIVKI